MCKLSSFSYASFSMASSCLYTSSSDFKNSFSCKTEAIVGSGLGMTGSCVVVIASLAGSCGAAIGMVVDSCVSAS